MWMCPVSMVSFRVPCAITSDLHFFIMQCQIYLSMELAAYPISSVALCAWGRAGLRVHPHVVVHVRSQACQCVWSLAPL
jgi:hypothetical protein